MPSTSLIFNDVKRGWMAGEIAMVTNTITVTPIMDTSECETLSATLLASKNEVADIDSASLVEIDGGYAGGYGGADQQDLGTKTVTNDSTDDEGVFDAANTVFSALLAGTNNVAGVLIFKDLTSYALSTNIGWVAFTPDITANGGDLTITWAAEGIININ